MAMNLNKGVGGSIMPSDAKIWIQNYLDKNPGQTESHFFGSDIIQSILSQTGCVGIRIHHAIDDKEQKQLLLVGAKDNGNSIWRSSVDSTANGIIGDQSWPCPPACYENPL